LFTNKSYAKESNRLFTNKNYVRESTHQQQSSTEQLDVTENSGGCAGAKGSICAIIFYPGAPPETSSQPPPPAPPEPNIPEPEPKSSPAKVVQIRIKGVYNSYGIQTPSSRAEYDAMVAVLQQTTYDTARASKDNGQKINGVDVVKIEGISPEDFRRKLQVSTCTFKERRECCFNSRAAKAKAGFCASLGCNVNLCRRLRIDIIAQQALRTNRNLQSVRDAYVQDVAMNLYNTITQYMTEEVESGAYTVSLRNTARGCGDICLNTMADATVTDVEFLPPDDILIVDPTNPRIRREPTAAPTDEPHPSQEPNRVREKIKSNSPRCSNGRNRCSVQPPA
jgi:hypothetical protein